MPLVACVVLIQGAIDQFAPKLWDVNNALQGSAEIRAIRQAAERGADLVKRILTFSRRVESYFAPVNLNEEGRQTERLLYRTLPKMINIELRLEGGLDRISADSSQIEQLLLNLAINAKIGRASCRERV